MTVASLKRHSRIAVFASILLVAFVAQLPGAFAQDTVTTDPSEVATTPADTGAVSAAFDPNAEGTNSPGVLTGEAARHSGWMCFGRHATIVGTSHNDRLYGTKEQDVIVGLGGADLISSGEKNDRICAGDGEDQAYGLGGYDRIDGGYGSDTLIGGDGNDLIQGRSGDDTINGEGGTDFINGAGGRDTINGGSAGTASAAAAATVRTGLGGDSNDFIRGGPQNDSLNGGDGNDSMWGQGGDDTLNGDVGDDRMQGGPGRDAFIGGEGNDTMTGGPAADSFDGEGGNDTVFGDGGIDSVSGGSGQDAMHGGNDSDLINGGGDGDAIYGDGGTDILCGGDAVDTLFGGQQDDLVSGEGDCTWSGTATALVFSADSSSPANLIDGGAGFDTCVSPSAARSPQTVHCEGAGIFYLEVTVVGSGGYVTGVPVDMFGETNLNCDSSTSPCRIYYLPSTDVTLTAHETTGVFSQWTGDVSSCGSFSPTSLQCEFIMNQNRKVTATFVAATQSLGVSITGPAHVTSSPTGINCPSTCSAIFDKGSLVSLTGSGATNYSWGVTGATISSGCTTTASCVVRMTADGSVTLTST